MWWLFLPFLLPGFKPTITINLSLPFSGSVHQFFPVTNDQEIEVEDKK